MCKYRYLAFLSLEIIENSWHVIGLWVLTFVFCDGAIKVLGQDRDIRECWAMFHSTEHVCCVGECLA